MYFLVGYKINATFIQLFYELFIALIIFFKNANEGKLYSYLFLKVNIVNANEYAPLSILNM